MRMIPKCTGSMPKAMISGYRVGVAISKIAVVSIKQPMTNKTTLMIAKITSLLSEIDIMNIASFCGACDVATIQPKGTAQAMMNTSTPQVIRVSRSESMTSLTLSSR